MTEMEMILDQQRQAAAALLVDPANEGYRAWIRDYVAEEVLILLAEKAAA